MNTKKEIVQIFQSFDGFPYDYMEDLKSHAVLAGSCCVFGLGSVSNHAIPMLVQAGIPIDFLCDNNPALWGKKKYGIPCISPDELFARNKNIFVIVTTEHYYAISKQLKENGLNNHCLFSKRRVWASKYHQSKEKMSEAGKCFGELADLLDAVPSNEVSQKTLLSLVRSSFCTNVYEQPNPEPLFLEDYFPEGIIELNEQEHFVDCGAYDGDTLRRFLSVTNNTFGSIHAFELDSDNFEKLEFFVQNIDAVISDKIRLYNIGVWNKAAEMKYEAAEMGSHLTDHSGKFTRIAQLARVDDILMNQKATYVKMDIEGAEPEALYGMETLIKTQKPKLAICLYHSFEHLWELPLLIHSFVPEYKLHIIHHSAYDDDIVCYAVR